MPRIKKAKEDADLDITSFMNLMIVLVPVLLLNMVFAQTMILDIKLPPGSASSPDDPKENQQIELIIRQDHMTLNYPAGVLMRQFPKKDDKYDYKGLSEFLQELKPALEKKLGEKKDILILSEERTDYQTLVSVMDTVRSYKAVVATSVVNAELFPDISLGDAPGDKGSIKSQAAKEGSK